ncbi:MAG: hypothetical protein JWQ54_1840 [Mucilaginibacter sp.]|nr:hypothetical protein [Mucilaginibacter sp.]
MFLCLAIASFSCKKSDNQPSVIVDFSITATRKIQSYYVLSSKGVKTENTSPTNTTFYDYQTAVTTYKVSGSFNAIKADKISMRIPEVDVLNITYFTVQGVRIGGETSSDWPNEIAASFTIK